MTIAAYKAYFENYKVVIPVIKEVKFITHGKDLIRNFDNISENQLLIVFLPKASTNARNTNNISLEWNNLLLILTKIDNEDITDETQTTDQDATLDTAKLIMQQLLDDSEDYTSGCSMWNEIDPNSFDLEFDLNYKGWQGWVIGFNHQIGL